MLLSETFQPTTVAPDQFMTAMDLYLYYDWENTLWYKRPDWFAVVGVPRLHPQSDFRYSYVPWHEGVPPLIVDLEQPRRGRTLLDRAARGHRLDDRRFNRGGGNRALGFAANVDPVP